MKTDTKFQSKILSLCDDWVDDVMLRLRMGGGSRERPAQFNSKFKRCVDALVSGGKLERRSKIYHNGQAGFEYRVKEKLCVVCGLTLTPWNQSENYFDYCENCGSTTAKQLGTLFQELENE
jgi:hypothetical protein